MRVAVMSAWGEDSSSLIERMARNTPGLEHQRFWWSYKSIDFVAPSEPHTHTLIFNQADRRVKSRPHNTYVLILEPPEILGPTHAWLDVTSFHDDVMGLHPQRDAHIYSFSGGTPHPHALGVHLVQATLTDLLPSVKQRRCAMICSDKVITPWQVKRREVLEALLESDLDIEFWGRGMKHENNRVRGEIKADLKDEAIQPYSFVIDFENSQFDALTDKFIDPILGGAIPVTNSTAAATLFPHDSFEFVNMEASVESIVNRITWIVSQPPENLARYDEPLRQARELVTTGPLNICEWFYRELRVK